jgi:hypothetical protein
MSMQSLTSFAFVALASCKVLCGYGTDADLLGSKQCLISAACEKVLTKGA